MENLCKKKKRVCYFYQLIFIFLLFSYTSETFAQTTPEAIQNYFNFFKIAPQEKLYLHLDKPFYGAGEKIWFKGYLVNAITHQNDTQSNFIITELIDRSDSIIIRKKIRRDSIGFANNFELPAELPQGDYYIRGYTNWMLNEEPEFFYSHPIRIGNSIDVSIISTIEYQQEDDNVYIGKIKFTDESNRPLTNIKVRYELYDKDIVTNKSNLTTDSEGYIRILLPNLKENNNQRHVEVEFNDPLYKYNRSFYLPNLSDDFDVQFLPEGGELLVNIPKRIAFKMQKANGSHGNLTGQIINELGEEIISIKTEHDGMGIFSLTPEKGKSYFAEVTSEEGMSKRFQLPMSKEEGFSIAIYQRKQEVFYQIQKTPTTLWPSSLYLIAHTRGNISILQEIESEKLTGKIDKTALEEGISHFLLVTQEGIPLCERLCFIRHPETKWNLSTNKTDYAKREKVIIQLEATDKYNRPLNGEFSVSITDAATVTPDSLSNHIVSNLLLTSDLKGYIENPGYYFLSHDSKTETNLDLVMLTHGWRRFKTDNLLERPKINTTHFIEKGQYISGKITGFWGGKVKDGSIIAFAPKIDLCQIAKTDEKGEFVIENISFPDSTGFFIQARNKKGFKGVDVVVSPTYFPTPKSSLLFSDEPIRFMDDYLINTREKYYYEGGMRVINMEEVVVKGSKKPSFYHSIYGGAADHIIGGEQLEKMNMYSIYTILTRFPGVRLINGNEIRIRNNTAPPAVIVNGDIYDYNDFILDQIQVTDIASIEVIKSAGASLYNMGGAGGLIVINLKEGTDISISSRPMPGRTVLSPLGYSPTVEFYHPTYDTPAEKRNSQPDLRTTLYWNPSLTFDENGIATIEYYTSDNSIIQNIVLEGIDEDGTIYRYSGRVN